MNFQNVSPRATCTTTQKDHAGRGVTEIQWETWRLFTLGHPSEPWKKIIAYIKKCHIQKNSYVTSGDLLMTIFVQNRSHARIFNLEEFRQRIVHNWIATNIELKLHSYLIQLIRFLNIFSHKICISRPIFTERPVSFVFRMSMARHWPAA